MKLRGTRNIFIIVARAGERKTRMLKGGFLRVSSTLDSSQHRENLNTY